MSGLSIACNAEIIEALRKTLTEYKATTNLNVDAHNVAGVIQYSHTAFSWDDAAYTRHSELMSVLTTATKVTDGKHVKWGQECIDACVELYTHIMNVYRPMAYWSHHEILTEVTTSCLMELTNTSDGPGLWPTAYS